MNDAKDDWDAVATKVKFTSPLNLDLLANTDPDARVLDLGCGYGRQFAALQRNGYRHIVGYDRSAALVQRGLIENPDYDLRLGDATSLPERDGSFQIAVMAGLLTTIPSAREREKVLLELRRVLAPGAEVVGVEFARSPARKYDDSGCFVASNGIRMQHFRPDEIRSLFAAMGRVSHDVVKSRSLSGAEEQVIQFHCRADS